MFELIKKGKNQWRVGLLKTRRGFVRTPVFMPIATKGAVKNLTREELKELGAELILGNTYHLWLRPGSAIIKKSGGLHKFMNWPGPILTDSGGYQVFSLGEKFGSADGFQKRKIFPSEENFTRQNCSLVPLGRDTMPARNFERFGKPSASPRVNGVKISDAGVEFRDPFDGHKYFLTPEKSIEIQSALDSDIIMVFDECPPYPASREQVEKAVARTTKWAERCKKFFEEKTKNRSVGQKPLLFCIVQGGIYKDLRQRSAKELLTIGFDGYAIGGVAVGEPRNYLQKVMDYVLPLLPEDKPRYLMGLGKPEEIVAAVKSGVDMFDCVIPTREARHGRIYKFKVYPVKSREAGTAKQLFNRVKSEKLKVESRNFYETLEISNAKFVKDFKPIDKNCSCYTCQNYSRAYLCHLFRTAEPLAQRLATIHNLKFYLELMESLRQ